MNLVSAGMDLIEFEKHVCKVCAWFEQLNPYEEHGPILEFEDQNFIEDSSRKKHLEPLYCAAISAKRCLISTTLMSRSFGRRLPIAWAIFCHLIIMT
jgi:hypothetical protein